jgi:hypothetical protein
VLDPGCREGEGDDGEGNFEMSNIVVEMTGLVTARRGLIVAFGSEESATVRNEAKVGDYYLS